MSDSGPHERLAESVSKYLGMRLPDSLPRKWEKFSDVVLLPSDAFTSRGWAEFRGHGLWRAVADGLGATRLGQIGEVTGDYRESGVRMLLGDDDWVIWRESGVDYGYNMTKCMFSAGNVNERRRMGEVGSQGEVVVDMFSGIGYYSLPVLIHSEAAHVHCCEWNPEAIGALKWNLKRNGVRENCTIHEGDNRQSSGVLKGVADRVILGLLPTSESSFGPSIEVLRESGGTIHVHGLANSDSHREWSEEVVRNFRGLDPSYEFAISDIVRVKSYAPKWDHLVLDIRVN